MTGESPEETPGRDGSPSGGAAGGAPGEGAAAVLLRRAALAGVSLAAAESLTGGLVAAALTGVPGASRTFRGSVTAYATDRKAAVLGVDTGLLERAGAVDPTVAAQMAEGVRRLMDAGVGLATTGVAGPDPQDGRPVGTVYVAVAGPSGTVGGAFRFSGDRAAIRAATVEAVLRLASDVLHGTAHEGTAEPNCPE